MSRKEEMYWILGLIVAVLGCIAAWLTLPQIQAFFSKPTPVVHPTALSFAPTSEATNLPTSAPLPTATKALTIVTSTSSPTVAQPTTTNVPSPTSLPTTATPTLETEIPLERMTILEGTWIRKPSTVIRGQKYPGALFFPQERIVVRLLQNYKTLTMKVGVDDQAGLSGWKHFWVKDNTGNVLFEAEARPVVEPVSVKVDILHADWIEITALDYNAWLSLALC